MQVDFTLLGGDPYMDPEIHTGFVVRLLDELLDAPAFRFDGFEVIEVCNGDDGQRMCTRFFFDLDEEYATAETQFRRAARVAIAQVTGVVDVEVKS
jgi:hypothetical protein